MIIFYEHDGRGGALGAQSSDRNRDAERRGPSGFRTNASCMLALGVHSHNPPYPTNSRPSPIGDHRAARETSQRHSIPSRGNNSGFPPPLGSRALYHLRGPRGRPGTDPHCGDDPFVEAAIVWLLRGRSFTRPTRGTNLKQDGSCSLA